MPEFEHERKFLVADSSVVGNGGGAKIEQGYLGAKDGYSVRVRYCEGVASSRYEDMESDLRALHVSETGFVLAVKGPRSGVTRAEEEVPLPYEVGVLLMAACGDDRVVKTRHPVLGPDGLPWIVDVFAGRNEGLVLAEFEAPSPTTSFLKPPWCGDDVTNDVRFYNDYLSRQPYQNW